MCGHEKRDVVALGEPLEVVAQGLLRSRMQERFGLFDRKDQ